MELPDEMILHMVGFFPVIDAINLSFTCKKMFQILKDTIMKIPWSLNWEYHTNGKNITIHELYLNMGYELPSKEPCYLCDTAHFGKDFYSHSSVDFKLEDVRKMSYVSSSKEEWAYIIARLFGKCNRTLDMNGTMLTPRFKRRNKFKNILRRYIQVNVDVRSGYVLR